MADFPCLGVRIDGDTYRNSVLQSGINITVGDEGSQSYDSWYEGCPDYAQDFSVNQFSFTAGDVISIPNSNFAL